MTREGGPNLHDPMPDNRSAVKTRRRQNWGRGVFDREGNR